MPVNSVPIAPATLPLSNSATSSSLTAVDHHLNGISPLQLRCECRGEHGQVAVLHSIAGEHVGGADHDGLPLLIDRQQDGRLQLRGKLHGRNVTLNGYEDGVPEQLVHGEGRMALLGCTRTSMSAYES